MLQSRYLVRQAHMLERVRWKRDWRNDGRGSAMNADAASPTTTLHS